LKLCTLKRQSKLFQKHLLTFLASTDSKNSKHPKKKKIAGKEKKKRLSGFVDLNMKSTSVKTHIRTVMSADSSTAAVRAEDIHVCGL